MKHSIWSMGLVTLAINVLASGAAIAAQEPGADPAAAPAKQDYVLFVEVRVKPESVAEFKQAILAIVGPTQAETGNLAYVVHQAQDDPTDFMVYEHWQTDEDHTRHLHSPIFVSYSHTVAPMIATGYPIRKKMAVLDSE